MINTLTATTPTTLKNPPNPLNPLYLVKKTTLKRGTLYTAQLEMAKKPQI